MIAAQGKGGNRIGYWNCSGGQHDCQIWAKELHDGSYAIALYNAVSSQCCVPYSIRILMQYVLNTSMLNIIAHNYNISDSLHS